MEQSETARQATTHAIDHEKAKDYEALTQQTYHLSRVQEQLSTAHQKSEDFLSAICQIKSHIDKPYDELVHKHNILKRLVATSDMLRSVIRILQLSRKIQTRAADPNRMVQREAVKTRQLVQEFESIIQSDQNLMRVNQVVNEVKAVEQVKAEMFS